REIEAIYQAEGTARIGLALERLLAGLDTLGMDRKQALAIVKEVALDSVPPLRRRAYDTVCKYANIETGDIPIDLALPTTPPPHAPAASSKNWKPTASSPGSRKVRASPTCGTSPHGRRTRPPPTRRQTNAFFLLEAESSNRTRKISSLDEKERYIGGLGPPTA